MTKVTIQCDEAGEYWLAVPGLAEKRPSLLRGKLPNIVLTQKLNCIV